ncbi:MAG: D-glycero-beta-D-manno-heptose 1,7-bisphosphate 7-phosphatase [Gammaproteobacteria bacterium]|nr:MAG: D-glycero-beta-D-manno-heptose 1,7-bisphosphate 7-phosphatase [Gammaproteobacteria bacterium]UCH39434.1 MAG: D-glycero-beta-D-manno-heptose 1,7-bisphosphate 7-phosphatase [Gammaproteobacteria bacterium]
MRAKMVILDRDGVINHMLDGDVTSADDWDPIPGSIEAISRLKKAGYLVTVASNQSGIARGQYSEKDLQAMHDKMQKLLAARGVSVDGIFYCPHGPEANCICRKPKPGLLYQIAKQFDIDLSQTPLVGDNISDIRAAKMANAKPILVRTGKGEYVMQHFPEALDVPVYDDLAHFVRETLRKK